MSVVSSDLSTQEARWRNYQQFIWTQQQIHIHIQQQQQKQQVDASQQGPQISQPPPQHPLPLQTDKVEKENVDESVNSFVNPVMGSAQASAAVPIGESSISLEMGETNEGSGVLTTPDKSKDLVDPWDNLDAHAAFLGPTLWEKRLPYDGQDFKLEYVDLEEFLSENGIPLSGLENPLPSLHSTSVGATTSGNDGSGASSSPSHCREATQTTFTGVVNGKSQSLPPTTSSSLKKTFSGSPLSSCSNAIGASTVVTPESTTTTICENGASSPGALTLAVGEANVPLLPVLSHSSRSPTPVAEMTGPPSVSQDIMSPDSSHDSELSLSSVPGGDFDPRTRCFSEDELKPQPMIKKSRKQFVPEEAKDAKYWARRRKNNMAAKRSRDARRVKENQIAMRACFLEKQNGILKQELERVQKENLLLNEQLTRCHREH